MGQHQGRPLHTLDYLGYGEGLAGTSDAEQRLPGESRFQPLDQGLDGSGLITGGFVVADNG